jgi:hypothetical protein
MSETRDRDHDHDRQEHDTIKVVDRRQFTREGERRNPDATSEPAPAPPAPERSSPLDPAAASKPAARPNILFAALVQSLYMNTLMALGEVENPMTRQFETNLDLARENIDMLEMLREKTSGNLAPEEEDYLLKALPQLEMLYVRKAR